MSLPAVSFEFFPPKNLEASFRLWDTVQSLGPLDPSFVSVTYGAGGSTRELTRDAVATIHKNTDLTVAAHLTCVNATKTETLAIAETYEKSGVSEIVALRGDPPKGSNGFEAHPDGFKNSCELISTLAQRNAFKIRVGAYPEQHPEALNSDADIQWLKAKIDAGAHSAITQFFFDAETFLRFRDKCVAAGIDAPIIPGILPIENWNGARKFAKSCGTSIPQLIIDGFENATREGTTDLLATAVATELCSDLMDEGVDHLHFYTLNRPALTRDVCHAIGVTPKIRLEKVA